MKHLLALLLGCGLALLSLEGVSRWYYDYRLVDDPQLGLVVPAGHTVRSRVEGAGVAHFEAHGVRRAADLGPRTGIQILCVGDSFTEALQVADDDVFTTLLERSLKRSGLASAVVSFGRSGWSAADLVAEAPRLRATFAPRWVVVQVREVDFGAQAWSASATRFRRPCRTCPLEVVRGEPTPEGAARRCLRRLRNRSALVGFGLFCLQRNRFGAGPRGGGQAAWTRENGAADAATSGEYPVREELSMLAGAFDGRLTLLLLGSFDPADPARETDAEVEVERVARELGISVACAKEEYPALAEQGMFPFGFANTTFNYGHLNPAGHAAVARVLTRELLRVRAEGRL
jgi:hypothetical protein